MDDIKCKLLAYNKPAAEINVSQIARISGVSQSNIIIVMKTGETHTGYMIQF